jgi:hypothetical protein
MNSIKLLPVLASVLIAGGCSVQQEYVQTELYIGLSQNNGVIIPDSAWNSFVANDVAKVFPNGLPNWIRKENGMTRSVRNST